ncbi:YceD family protein [Arthrospiribacter ruber]|uniref:DUF177 domain-containing protein n=1 Tax=Arthrospiribacter ruber TaxID=2487934 RepID=A0A951MCB9_9BACT|nr:DUF177 domain-containing protein [Arthrospiribacter ruber]MBW3466221.1 DUF177 domain-containing protein [Arthrospiribacter ruber]
MKFLRTYDIDIIKLKEGKHTFEFNVGDEFFRFYEADDWVNGADLTVNVHLNKTASLMEASFEINGTIGLTCDRSLEEFDYTLTHEELMIYKYGPMEQEISEDVQMITRDTSSINVAQLIYEFILLAIPAKKIHPDYMDDEDEDEFGEEEGTVVYVSDENQDKDSDSSEQAGDSKPADPRWEILNKLKHKD